MSVKETKELAIEIAKSNGYDFSPSDMTVKQARQIIKQEQAGVCQR